MTDNAVRTHLSSLERDGLVRQKGVRRAVGKPAYVYDVTPAAEQLFSKAYDRCWMSLASACPRMRLRQVLSN